MSRIAKISLSFLGLLLMALVVGGYLWAKPVLRAKADLGRFEERLKIFLAHNQAQATYDGITVDWLQRKIEVSNFAVQSTAASFNGKPKPVFFQTAKIVITPQTDDGPTYDFLFQKSLFLPTYFPNDQKAIDLSAQYYDMDQEFGMRDIKLLLPDREVKSDMAWRAYGVEKQDDKIIKADFEFKVNFVSPETGEGGRSFGINFVYQMDPVQELKTIRSLRGYMSPDMQIFTVAQIQWQSKERYFAYRLDELRVPALDKVLAHAPIKLPEVNISFAGRQQALDKIWDQSDSLLSWASTFELRHQSVSNFIDLSKNTSDQEILNAFRLARAHLDYRDIFLLQPYFAHLRATDPGALQSLEYGITSMAQRFGFHPDPFFTPSLLALLNFIKQPVALRVQIQPAPDMNWAIHFENPDKINWLQFLRQLNFQIVLPQN